jgi:hypothetical protein
MRSRTLAILCASLALSTLRSNSETFFGPSNGGNKLLIASNEAIIISSIMAPAGVLNGDVLVSNSSYAVHLYPLGTTRLGLGGPAELRIPSPCAVYFKRLQNAAIRTVFLAGNDMTNGFLASAPSGKTLEFFDTMDGDVVPNAFLFKSGFSNQVQVAAGQRFDGPADVRFYNPTSGNAALFSYWLVEDVFQNPNAFVPSSSQTPQVMLEKSADLNLWQPVAVFGQSVGSNTFYRLRISK